jgi:ERCC4-type nuclease
MISIDDRIGSIELIPTLQSLAPILIKPSSGIPIPAVSSTRLLCGDACFDGLGRDNKHTHVGIERKRIRDMMNSIRSGRYSGKQLPEMLDFYDHSYLIIEGYVRCGPGGDLETLVTTANPQSTTLGGRWYPVMAGNRTFRYFELDHFIATIETHTPVKVRRTTTDFQTAAEILSIYTHHQRPPESHHAHQALHTPQNVATIGKAGLVRRVAACLNGIGWEKSAAVALKFHTVEEMVLAGPNEWKMPGIGKVLAQKAFDQLRGKYKDEKEEL